MPASRSQPRRLPNALGRDPHQSEAQCGVKRPVRHLPRTFSTLGQIRTAITGFGGPRSIFTRPNFIFAPTRIRTPISAFGGLRSIR